ncbi:hypothetical protein X777_11055, partial [Ooceraea biroi]
GDLKFPISYLVERDVYAVALTARNLVLYVLGVATLPRRLIFGDMNKRAQVVVNKHRLLENHEFDWPNVKILHNEKHTRKREIAEMIYIKSQSKAINLQRDTDCLSRMTNLILSYVAPEEDQK